MKITFDRVILPYGDLPESTSPPHSASGLTRSFIFKDLPDVAFAVKDTDNVHGVFLQSVINPNRFKPSNRP